MTKDLLKVSGFSFGVEFGRFVVVELATVFTVVALVQLVATAVAFVVQIITRAGLGQGVPASLQDHPPQCGQAASLAHSPPTSAS